MSKKIRIKLADIRECDLFAEVPLDIIKKIATYPVAQQIPAGTDIIKEGEVGDSMFIILNGSVDILKTNKMVKVATVSTGTFIGESALVSGAPRNATCRTTTPCKIAFFNFEAFNKLLISHPSIPSILMKTHTERCKTVVKSNSNLFAKSKKVILIFGLLGAVLFVKYGGDVFGLEWLTRIGDMIPDEIMAMFGPIVGVIMLKFQKMFIGDIVDKLEKI
jgi:hypothetical protein